MLKPLMIAAALLGATATATPALARDELVNNGLIDQVVDVKNTLELKQRQTVGSVQAANLVGSGDLLVNNGTIRQSVRAANVRLKQRQSVASTQALNAVLAGNPAASGAGY